MKEDLERVNRLYKYIQRLMNQEDSKQLYERYKSDFEKVTPQEIFEVFYMILQKGIEPKEILVILDKVINVFYKGLISYQWNRPEKGSFLDFLMMENCALLEKLEAIKEILNEKDLLAKKKKLIPRINELVQFNQHYLKKENILFPYLEKKMEKFNGLTIMWSLHDMARTQIKKVMEYLESETCKEAEINEQIGSLFFILHGIVKKEELILFPAASEVIEKNEWREMQKQSFEYEFPFIPRPKQQAESLQESRSNDNMNADINGRYKFKTETGELDFEQIVLLFNALPVDLTFVDENNRVRYFTRPKDRIFPRSPAIIGRDVDKCHPPESVHVVHKIMDSFRSGKKDTATFWINIKGKIILIQYFALRNAQGEYKGVLEASQDITEIKNLEGEKRLLGWEE
ncbi:DUF438 domain-containing protein [Clostridium aminobutyricum]|uniref:DUF438 domain-containing protein n=1 Tax=Clostridium aminobutyricum TaxID=33953 RepID=A0A939IIJ9_CLOAM|nr:PAS domain-containing protein [Clostridium aminobutyricum]MBN7772633.1 DUF438 domain-containing protein [Clostridium aminobutyricum]